MGAFDKALWGIGNIHTFVAEGALTIGKCVKLGTAGRQVKVLDETNTAPFIGIVYDNAASGAEVPIVTPYPIVPAIAGGAVTRGSYVGPGGNSGGVENFTFDGNGTTETSCLGVALDDGTDGQLVQVLMCGFGLKANK